MGDSIQGRRFETASQITVDSTHLAIGVDIGGTDLKAGIVDPWGDIRYEIRLSTRAEEGVDIVLLQIRKAISQLLIHPGSEGEEITGIGIGCPGLVDSLEGLVRVPPNLPGWEEVPLQQHLQQCFDVPVCIANDVNAMALGELYYGAACGYRDVVCLTLGTGVGGALIFKGELYTGFLGTAGEIGHITVEPDGPRCNCGNNGCLERLIGSRAIVERTLSKLGDRQADSSLSRLKPSELEPSSIAEAARAGDGLAIEVFQEVGEYLGIVLAGLINLLNPEAIIIGGGLANAGRLLLDPVEETVRRRSYSMPAERVRILPARLGNKAGIVGAATLVFLKHLSLPTQTE